jgi:dTDP-4-amino-4,6-dideoxygalactose transaminase
MIPISKPFIGEEEKRAVQEVLDSGMLVQGPRTAELEERCAAVCGTTHAIATSSGTTALHVALLAHDIGPGDEVITTPFTFIASVNAIIYTGATPVFVDIEEESFNINPDLIEAAITPKTKAILPVHLYGYPCDMGRLMQIADRHNLAVIEDAAQAIGATYHGQATGSFGTGCFSLYATKNVMSVEGGMITTNDDYIARRCRMIRNHGMERRYYHDILGFNFRMSDLHAAIGVEQLKRLDDFNTKRRANAEYFNQHLTNVITPTVREGYDHVWHQYTIRVRRPDSEPDGTTRDRAIKQLNEAGVGTGIFYPVPANKQRHLPPLGIADISVPVAERLANEVISLPVHPQLTQEDRETIVREVQKL